MNELFEYVKLTQNNDGYVTVEVVNSDFLEATQIMSETIEDLHVKGIMTPDAAELETKASNDNTKFQPTVTVKGHGPQVVETYLKDLKRMEPKKE